MLSAPRVRKARLRLRSVRGLGQQPADRAQEEPDREHREGGQQHLLGHARRVTPRAAPDNRSSRHDGVSPRPRAGSSSCTRARRRVAMPTPESRTPDLGSEPATSRPPAERRGRYDGFISYSHALDGRLAPAVQRALGGFAKSWRRSAPYASSATRPPSSASPELWSSIERAMDESEYFILFASRHAATSGWVSRELEHWLRRKPADRVLIVLTEGSLPGTSRRRLRLDRHRLPAGDGARRLHRGTALRGSALGPRGAGPTLQHPAFATPSPTSRATIQGRPKDELIGEDVRQHRRTVRLARRSLPR